MIKQGDQTAGTLVYKLGDRTVGTADVTVEDVQIEPYPFSDEADGLGISAPVKDHCDRSCMRGGCIFTVVFQKEKFPEKRHRLY